MYTTQTVESRASRDIIYCATVMFENGHHSQIGAYSIQYCYNVHLQQLHKYASCE